MPAKVYTSRYYTQARGNALKQSAFPCIINNKHIHVSHALICTSKSRDISWESHKSVKYGIPPVIISPSHSSCIESWAFSFPWVYIIRCHELFVAPCTYTRPRCTREYNVECNHFEGRCIELQHRLSPISWTN